MVVLVEVQRHCRLDRTQRPGIVLLEPSGRRRTLEVKLAGPYAVTKHWIPLEFSALRRGCICNLNRPPTFADVLQQGPSSDIDVRVPDLVEKKKINDDSLQCRDILEVWREQVQEICRNRPFREDDVDIHGHCQLERVEARAGVPYNF